MDGIPNFFSSVISELPPKNFLLYFLCFWPTSLNNTCAHYPVSTNMHRNCFQHLSCRWITTRSPNNILTPTNNKMKLTHKRDALEGVDPEQAKLMSEEVILVDHQDEVVGSMSKKDAHLTANNLPLHRAFSVFLFDSKRRMLLQKRAKTKVTFPSYWTNTVCSHPLHCPAEMGQNDAGNTVKGAKRAAIRKLSHELGILPEAIHMNDLTFMTRVMYRSPSGCGVWGEHELDYVFFAQTDVALKPEPNEVEETRYVTRKELKDMFAEAAQSDSVKLTPWFALIVQKLAWPWWDVLFSESPNLKDFQDDKIHNYIDNENKK